MHTKAGGPRARRGQAGEGGGHQCKRLIKAIGSSRQAAREQGEGRLVKEEVIRARGSSRQEAHQGRQPKSKARAGW